MKKRWLSAPLSMPHSILYAGLAGGMAEVLWVMLYSAITTANGTEIADQITASVIPAFAHTRFAPLLGLGIHFVLSVLIAVGFVRVILPRLQCLNHGMALLMGSLVVLAGIWLFNFFILLPILNPQFVILLPYSVTLVSKLLFGFAMAWVLQFRSMRQPVAVIPLS